MKKTFLTIKEDNIVLSFLTNEEALAKELHQEHGVDIIVENKDMILNPGNWYWCDNNNRIVARCYFEDSNYGYLHN